MRRQLAGLITLVEVLVRSTRNAFGTAPAQSSPATRARREGPPSRCWVDDGGSRRARALAVLAGAWLALLPPAARAQVDCETLAGNRIANCGFEAGNPAPGWTLQTGDSLTAGPPSETGRFGGAGVPGDGAIGTVLVLNVQSNCFAVPSPRHFAFGASFRRDVPPQGCGFQIYSYSTSDCLGFVLGSAEGGEAQVPSGAWAASSSFGLVQGPYAQLELGCWSAGAGQSEPYYLDNAFAVPEAAAVEIPTLNAAGSLLAAAGILAMGILTLRRLRRRHGAAIAQPLLVIPMLAAASSAARAEYALSVDYNALWRVDLSRHQGQILYTLETPDPMFACAIAVSSTGVVRCVRGGALYDIRPGAAQAIAPLPPLAAALAFDGDDRLWLASSTMIWQLDPITGAILESKPLTLVGSHIGALAALGNRLFVFSEIDHPGATYVEEIDPSTGASLSAVDVRSFGLFSAPAGAAFDSQGVLWYATVTGEIITGAPCLTYGRLRLTPLSHGETWHGCFDFYTTPTFASIAAISGQPAVEIPAINAVGTTILALLTLAIAGRRLRLARRPP